MSIAVDLIRKRLDAESKRINASVPGFGEYPKTNAVTESLNMLLVAVAFEEAKAAVKPIVDREVGAEDRAKGLHLRPEWEPLLTDLTHTRSCPMLNPASSEFCICGLEWRIRLRTEMEMHNAWRKRAEEAEKDLSAR